MHFAVSAVVIARKQEIFISEIPRRKKSSLTSQTQGRRKNDYIITVLAIILAVMDATKPQTGVNTMLNSPKISNHRIEF